MTIEFFKFQNIKAASEYAMSEGSSAVQYGHAVRVVNPKNRPTKLATTKIAPDVIERLEAMAASELPPPPSPDEDPEVDLDPGTESVDVTERFFGNWGD